MYSANVAKFFKTHFLQNTSVNTSVEQLVFNWLLKLAIYFYVNEVRYPDTKI